MKNIRMVGWGFASKINPQGKEYSSIMVWSSFNDLSNVMNHLAGYSVMKDLLFEKFNK
jgi:hypothetical protein